MAEGILTAVTDMADGIIAVVLVLYATITYISGRIRKAKICRTLTKHHHRMTKNILRETNVYELVDWDEMERELLN